MEKYLLIFTLIIITIKSIDVVVEKNNTIETKDSIIDYNRSVYLQDSALIRDIAVLPSDGKYDQVKMIFKMNNRNVLSYK